MELRSGVLIVRRGGRHSRMSFANSLWCEMESELTRLRSRDCCEISACRRSKEARFSETFSAMEEMSSLRLESSSMMEERYFQEG